MGIFTVARRMGTSVKMIDATYGHWCRDAEDLDRGLLDAYGAALMGVQKKSTAVKLRYAADIVKTFNATLRLAGEPLWTVEEQK
jgi:hypothetical protein